MKPWKICFWHGKPSSHPNFFEKIKKICRDQDGETYWDGSLDDFLKVWNDKCLIIPADDPFDITIAGLICVTPYSFAQR